MNSRTAKVESVFCFNFVLKIAHSFFNFSFFYPYLRKPSQIEPTYCIADFEYDVSGDIHKLFGCVIHNQNGTINDEFRRENCNKQLLKFIPDRAMIYFHNLRI